MMDSTGEIYHVVIYAGNGRTLEAKGRNYGIGSWTLDYGHACWAVRLLNDQTEEPSNESKQYVTVSDDLVIVIEEMR
jgi:cell wall-associated NlpC family hydrolase